MQFKLCYKSYGWKMSLDAMKQFKSKTGKDLWFTLVSFLEAYIENEGKPVLTLMKSLYNCVDFETASQILHVLAQQEDKSIELEQIQDAMYRVGWRPVEDENSEFIQPYPIVLFDIAKQIDKQFKEALGDVKKKALTG